MLEVLGRRRLTGVLALLVAMTAWLGWTQSAQAGVIAFNSGTMFYTMGNDSIANRAFLYRCTSQFHCASGDWVSIEEDEHAATMTLDGSAIAAGCVVFDGGSFWTGSCPAGSVGQVFAQLTGGDDSWRGDLTGFSGSALTASSIVFGGAGNDSITGTQLSDSLIGEAGNDTISGLAGNDTIVPGLGDDGTVDGGDGFDTTSYNDGRTRGVTVTLNGGGEDGGPDDGPVGTRENLTNMENIEGSQQADNLTGSAGGDSMSGLGGNDTMDGGAGSDSMSGGAGDDTMTGNTGNDFVGGSDGNDLIDGGLGADTLDGGAGSGDRFDYRSRATTDGVRVTLDNAANDGSTTTGAGTGTTSAEGDNVVNMEGGIGGGGKDFFDGSAMSVDLSFDGRSGGDQIFGGSGNDTLRGGGGADRLDGNNGIDTATYSERTASTDGISASLASGLSDSGSSADGGAGARDRLVELERLTGTEGNDTLIGNSGNNTINGLGGNDVIRGGKGNDSLFGGAGVDTVDYSYRTASEPTAVSFDGVNNDGGSGDSDILDPSFERVIGGAGNDTIIGDGAANTLIGGGGNDNIDGKGGADNVQGQAGDDRIESRDGVVDTIDCGAGTDTNNADSGDRRSNCELPAPPVVIPPPVVNPPVVNPPVNPPVVTPPKPLKIFDVSVAFVFFPLHPKKTTRFEDFVAKNVPKRTKITARCVKAKNGKKCSGKLGASMTIKRTKKKTNALKVLNRKYPAGSNLEVTFTKKGFRTKIKVIKILKNKRPKIATLCVNPGSTKRKSC